MNLITERNNARIQLLSEKSGRCSSNKCVRHLNCLIHLLGNSEIRQLDLSLFVVKHIFGFDVPVKRFVKVQVLQPDQDLATH